MVGLVAFGDMSLFAVFIVVVRWFAGRCIGTTKRRLCTYLLAVDVFEAITCTSFNGLDTTDKSGLKVVVPVCAESYVVVVKMTVGDVLFIGISIDLNSWLEQRLCMLSSSFLRAVEEARY